ncbi:FAD-binding oxidoreductase [Pacificimonas sp. WHA3]|uniref:FAD-binding oxidoreductase n=1 Tax=Pacificimonas pallii TaxID=2827236 RepID=A0ABS6SHZ8_9SPHN|nr:FAD-binding oxidoreductase [Pacificimonas pallii]MBV7257492.1 FAD-binding oxidoreductase [Pacificimonas pallii]
MKSYDALVIGGGLTGCASAYYLAKRGSSVLLAERNEINSLASGQNAGSLHFQLEHRLLQHGSDKGGEFARILPLNAFAIQLWQTLESELRADLEITMDGGLMLAVTDAEVALLKQKNALERSFGIDSELLTAAELRKLAPYLGEDVQMASYLAEEGHANPRLVTPAYARAAKRHGAILKTGCEVVLLKPEGTGWIAQLRNSPGEEIETVRIGMVLNAAGAFAAEAGRLAHLHLPVFPLPLTMSVTERTKAFLPHLLQRAGAKLSLKQVAAGNVLIGGGWSSRFERSNGVPDYRRRPRAQLDKIVGNIALATKAVPALAALHILRCWTGTVGVTHDELPLLGEVPQSPGYFVAVGGSGFTLGPAYAALIAELMVTRRTEHDISIYSPARFDHINNFMASA